MTTVVEEKRALPASKKIINIAYLTIIPNSQAEHSIYTYAAKVETHFDIKDPDFFNPAYTCLKQGDVVRIFRYEKTDIVNYYEFLITKVDKIAKKVQAVILTEKNIKKAGDK